MNDFDNIPINDWTQKEERRKVLIKSLRWEQEFLKKFICAELGKMVDKDILYLVDSPRFFQPGRNIAADFSTSPDFFFHKEGEFNLRVLWLNRKTKQLLEIHNLIENISKGKSNLTFPSISK